ncbi:MAG: alpha/beta hydrolase [Maribacter sp.]
MGEIEYNTVGKGIPVLFIHGGHSNCNEIFCHKGFDLEKFQLITPSRPGYGQTPLGKNKTPRDTADLIMKLVEHLCHKEIVVYGISAGGLTAIELAANYPDRVKKLILASAISKKWLAKDGRMYRTSQIIFNPKIEKFTWRMVRFFSKILPNLVAKSFYSQFSSNKDYKLSKSDIEELILAMKCYNSKTGFLNDIDQNIDDKTIAQIKCPTLIIHSANDNSVHLEHAKHSNSMIENSKIEILHNEWGHLLWIGNESASAIKKTIEFIKE